MWFFLYISNYPTIVKHQITLFEPIYKRRSKVLSTIPSFWTIIFENFGPELDEHITPDDWAFLGENLINVNVSRPDASNNPRSFDIIFGLKEDNGVVATTEIRKRFVYKSLKYGQERWTGLISEPVEIKWVNEDKDLTGGINRLAIKVFELRKKLAEGKIEEKKKRRKDGLKAKGKSAGKPKDDGGLSELELELEEKLNQHQSFFNWFSWTGEYFMVLEREAEAKLEEETKTNGEGVEDEDEGDEENEAIDVFPDGIKLAYLIADDMFPNVLKHFGMSWNCYTLLLFFFFLSPSSLPSHPSTNSLLSPKPMPWKILRLRMTQMVKTNWTITTQKALSSIQTWKSS